MNFIHLVAGLMCPDLKCGRDPLHFGAWLKQSAKAFRRSTNNKWGYSHREAISRLNASWTKSIAINCNLKERRSKMGFPVIYEILGGPQDWNRDRRFVFVTKRVLINIIRLMLGGSVSLMNSLAEAEEKRFKGKVQVIYINLPAVIEFGSKTLSRLAYLRDHLMVARELLTETGSIFVQISNKNIHLVRCLLDEIFGSENFIQPEQIKVLLNHLLKTELRGSSRESLKLFSDLLDFTLCYAKRKKEITQ